MTLFHYSVRNGKLRPPDLVGIMLDPARLRKNLLKFLLRTAVDSPGMVE